MTLEARHEEAIRRLRAYIFARYTAADLCINLASEKVAPAIPPSMVGADATLGGLDYRLVMRRHLVLSVAHLCSDKFVIHVSMFQINGPTITWLSVTARARYLSDQLKRLIDRMLEEESVCVQIHT